MSLSRPVVTVGGLTLVSRLFGLLREVAMAAILGAGPVAEAFIVAFRLPNLFRRLFAEGALTVAFVPMFARKLETEGQELAIDFFERTLAVLTTALIAITLVFLAAMPWAIYLLAGGFAERAETLDLTVLYARIAFPYLLLISLTGLLSGVLNAFRRFAAAAAAPILLNFAMIGALLLAEIAGHQPGLALAWAVPVAGLLQLLLVIGSARQIGVRLRWRRSRLDADIGRLVRLAAPTAFAAGVHQVNILAGTLIASFFAGAIAWLQYADRLYQLPLGVVGVALGVVLLPDLSRRLSADDQEGARYSFSRATEIGVALATPAAVGLAAIPESIVSTLFERGAFTAADTRETAMAVVLYALGLPAFVLGKVYASAFFAREDTRRPVRYASFAFALNTALAAAGALIWGYLAIPAATSLSAWILLGLLVRGARHHMEARPDASLRRRFPRILIASATMGGLLVLADHYLASAVADPTLRYPALAILVGGGLAVYAGAGSAIGAFRLSEILATLRPRRGGNAIEADSPEG